MTAAPTLLRTSRFANDAADLIARHAHEAIRQRGLFRLGLAGGNTPRTVYSALLAVPLPWDHIQITFGDERCVPPTHPDSNFRMASEALLEHVPIPSGNIFRIAGEEDPEAAATHYAAKLAAIAQRFGESVYRHDVLLLGLGEDGHTASLFPHSPALAENQKTVIPTLGPKPPPQRITFTFPLLNASREIVFLINDPAKEPVITEALEGKHPAGNVRPSDGRITWVIGQP